MSPMVVRAIMYLLFAATLSVVAFSVWKLRRHWIGSKRPGLTRISTYCGQQPPSRLSYPAASQASLQTKMSSRLAAGVLKCSSTAIRSCSGKRRMMAATLRH